jgi:transcriptional activator SPT8
LNIGKNVREFQSHGAQLAGICLRPENAVNTITVGDSELNDDASMSVDLQPEPLVTDENAKEDEDARSDASFDPLFDDEPEEPQKAQLSFSSLGFPTGKAQPRSRPQNTAPKHAPPLIDAATWSTYSPDVLMTVSIDGQILLWDRRAETPGKGVGRLWMSEKTPPWCLSVDLCLSLVCSANPTPRLVGLRMALRSMQGDEIARSTFGMSGS